ncbi:MAG TPA: tetratricopeptide repeat protein [Candidatus Acidoferrum sp.]|nr:tetratricopeptide repeat protein [Candidatus Acidoferrum sp.]
MSGRTFLLAVCVVGILGSIPLALAQHENHEPKEAIGWVPQEVLERPLPLRQGIGKLHEAVTTTSSEAQLYYDQGLAYLHSYVWIEAARSFHQALRLDPSMAMAYVGLSDVYVGLLDVPRAVAAEEKAKSLAAKVSDRERTRITLRALQMDYLQDSGDIKKYFAYRQALSDALAANPNDPWLWILRGFADEGTPTAHGQGGAVDTIAFYQTALRLSPDNFAAHHYLAHTLENHGPAKEALEQSEIYVRMCPGIPHAHHMHGHDLRKVGQTEQAIQEFLKAEELEDNYYRAENIPAKFDWHHAHNLQLLALSYEALGQMKSAAAAFEEAFALPSYTDFADYNRKAWPEFLLDRGQAQEALLASQELLNSRWAMARFAGHSLAGRAQLALNHMEDARSELTLAERETEQIQSGVLKSLSDSVLLRAEIMLREGKLDEANPLMERILKDIVAVSGPDAWSEALFQLEYIARVAREAGDWTLAESAAREIIGHDPTYAGGYFALGLVAEHKGNTPTAKKEFAMAQKLWSKADANLQPSHVQKP